MFQMFRVFRPLREGKAESFVTAAVVTRMPWGCSIRTPYHSGFVDDLKLNVPGFARSWDKSRRRWTVDDAYVELALRIVGRHFPGYTLEDQRPRATPRTEVESPWPRMLHDALPERLRTPVYRALSRVLHPDAGGDTRLMQELNDGWPHPVHRRSAPDPSLLPPGGGSTTVNAEWDQSKEET